MMHEDVKKIFPGDESINPKPFTDLEHRQIREAILCLARFKLKLPVNMRRIGKLLILGAAIGVLFNQHIITKILKLLGLG